MREILPPEINQSKTDAFDIFGDLTWKVAPQVELVEVAGSEHHVTLDNPRVFVEVVKGFLSQSVRS